MAITNIAVEKTYSGVVSGNNISVDMPLDVKSELTVYYGSTRLAAIQDVDYTLTLNETDYSDFVLKPLSSLLTKIANAGTGNVVYLHRTVAYTSDFVVGDAFFRDRIVKAFDRVMMRFQQIGAYLKTGANHNITVSTEEPTGGEDGDIWLRVPSDE